MKTIWKYTLEITDLQKIKMPIEAKPLSVHEQNGELCLWALVNSDNEDVLENILFYILGTGHNANITESLTFIGTVVMHNGLVWHVWFDNWR